MSFWLDDFSCRRTNGPESGEDSGPFFPPVNDSDLGPRLSCLLRHSRLCLFNQFGKSRGIFHGDIGENLAVELDAGLFQSADEARVACAVQLACGRDAHNPERSELALLFAAALVGKLQAALNS